MNFNSSSGIKLAFYAAIVSGISIFINKFAVGLISSPLLFTATKNLAVALFLLGLVISTKKYSSIKHYNSKTKVSLLLVGIIGGGIPFFLFFTGLTQTSAINASLIHKSLVIWVSILAVPFLKEKPNRAQITAIGLLYISNLFIGGFEGFSYSVGELMILAATILWALETILAKKLLKYIDSEILVLARMGIGALFLFTAAIILEPQNLGQIGSLSIGNISIITLTVLGLLAYVTTWYKALKAAPAITVSTILVGATVVTNILSAVFVTRTLNQGIFLQMVLIAAGISIYVLASKNTKVIA